MTTLILIFRLFLNCHTLATLRKNRKGLPKDIEKRKVAKGHVFGKENKDGIVETKLRDKREVLIFSTHPTL